MIATEVVHNSFKQLQLELRAQGLSKHIRGFNGEGFRSRRFQEWVRDVERVGTALEADNERYRALALQSLKGPAADYLSRILKTNQWLGWNQIKQRLAAQYSDQGDAHIALQKLRRLTQQKSESVQNFGERVLAMAEDAYPNEDLLNPFIQTILIETLTDGVIEDSTARRIIRDRPNTFARALRLATDEQQANRAFNIRRREDPMDVDLVAGGRDNTLTEIQQNLDVLTTQMAGIMEIKSGKQTKPNTIKFKWTEDGKPICHYCGKVGHLQQKCFSKRKAEGQRNPKPEGN